MPTGSESESGAERGQLSRWKRSYLRLHGSIEDVLSGKKSQSATLLTTLAGVADTAARHLDFVRLQTNVVTDSDKIENDGFDTEVNVLLMSGMTPDLEKTVSEVKKHYSSRNNPVEGGENILGAGDTEKDFDSKFFLSD